MHLSNIISAIPPLSFSDDASGSGLKEAVDDSATWLNLHSYHASLFYHLVFHRPTSVERFTYYNLCGPMLDCLWHRLTDEQFDRAVGRFEGCVFSRPLQTLYAELASRLVKGGCPSEKVKVRSVKLLRSLNLQPTDVVRVATCNPRVQTPQRSTWVLVSSLAEDQVMECLKLLSSVFECGVSARIGSVLCQCMHILNYEVPPSVIGGLVQGVSGRIEKSELWIRREGMIVGEALARCTGNGGGERMFEELGDYRVYTGWEETKVEVNLGDNQEEGENQAESNAAASDSDYSSDSEDDLSPVQRPLYCRDLMRLFHAQENDPDRREKIEVALKETPNVVKERGADGEVVGWGLAREVFNLSNEYDIPDFTALRERCMVAIITEFPRLGCEYFTGEVFGEGRGMGGRWDAVDALCKSAMELAGHLDETSAPGLPKKQIAGGGEKVKGKRGIVKVAEGVEGTTAGGKTRRWGKSAKSGPKKIANRWNPHFGFFFSQLLSAFTESKTDKALWSTTGSDLLVSKVLHALTLYIELARSQPGLDPCVRALFEMAYSFRSAESLAVKEAALLTVKVCLGVSTAHNALGILESKDGGFEKYIDDMEEEGEENLRLLAKAVKGEVGAKMGEVLGLTNG
ncbi:hypothetical protein TrCOL_g9868 [Triparma columacea]|nr:hypothetical protein TrCOL_g9868 [Triparma columacea]